MENSFDLNRDPSMPSDEELRCLAELQARERREFYLAFVKVRRTVSDYMKRTVGIVLEPVCEHCYGWQSHLSDSWAPPDITPDSWKEDLRGYGVTRAELKRFERDDYWCVVDCCQCRQPIHFDRTAAYVRETTFDSYFD